MDTPLKFVSLNVAPTSAKSLKDAIEWTKKAAANGCKIAQKNLGIYLKESGSQASQP